MGIRKGSIWNLCRLVLAGKLDPLSPFFSHDRWSRRLALILWGFLLVIGLNLFQGVLLTRLFKPQRPEVFGLNQLINTLETGEMTLLQPSVPRSFEEIIQESKQESYRRLRQALRRNPPQIMTSWSDALKLIDTGRYVIQSSFERGLVLTLFHCDLDVIILEEFAAPWKTYMFNKRSKMDLSRFMHCHMEAAEFQEHNDKRNRRHIWQTKAKICPNSWTPKGDFEVQKIQLVYICGTFAILAVGLILASCVFVCEISTTNQPKYEETHRQHGRHLQQRKKALLREITALIDSDTCEIEEPRFLATSKFLLMMDEQQQGYFPFESTVRRGFSYGLASPRRYQIVQPRSPTNLHAYRQAAVRQNPAGVRNIGQKQTVIKRQPKPNIVPQHQEAPADISSLVDGSAPILMGSGCCASCGSQELSIVVGMPNAAPQQVRINGPILLGVLKDGGGNHVTFLPVSSLRQAGSTTTTTHDTPDRQQDDDGGLDQTADVSIHPGPLEEISENDWRKLSRHERQRIMRQKTIGCSKCGKQIRVCEARRHAMVRHMDVKRFRCPLCPSQFAQIFAIRGHVRRRHPEIDPSAIIDQMDQIAELHSFTFTACFGSIMADRPPENRLDITEVDTDLLLAEVEVPEKAAFSMRKRSATCSKCGLILKSTIGREGWRHVMTRHIKGSLFECLQCNATFNRIDKVRAHCRTTHNGEQKFKDNTQAYKAPIYKMFTECFHSLTTEELQAKLSARNSKNTSNLNESRRQKRRSEKLEGSLAKNYGFCQLCQKEQYWKAEHVRTEHMKTESFNCRYCDHKCSSELAIRKHVMSDHSIQKDVEAAFANECDEVEERRAEFSLCFSQCFPATPSGVHPPSVAMRRAVDAAASGNLGFCVRCNVTVVGKLKEHVFTHHVSTSMQQRYKCPSCEKSFGKSSHVVRHIAGNHPAASSADGDDDGVVSADIPINLWTDKEEEIDRIAAMCFPLDGPPPEPPKRKPISEGSPSKSKRARRTPRKSKKVASPDITDDAEEVEEQFEPVEVKGGANESISPIQSSPLRRSSGRLSAALAKKKFRQFSDEGEAERPSSDLDDTLDTVVSEDDVNSSLLDEMNASDFNTPDSSATGRKRRIILRPKRFD